MSIKEIVTAFSAKSEADQLSFAVDCIEHATVNVLTKVRTSMLFIAREVSAGRMELDALLAEREPATREAREWHAYFRHNDNAGIRHAVECAWQSVLYLSEQNRSIVLKNVLNETMGVAGGMAAAQAIKSGEDWQEAEAIGRESEAEWQRKRMIEI